MLSVWSDLWALPSIIRTLTSTDICNTNPPIHRSWSRTWRAHWFFMRNVCCTISLFSSKQNWTISDGRSLIARMAILLDYSTSGLLNVAKTHSSTQICWLCTLVWKRSSCFRKMASSTLPFLMRSTLFSDNICDYWLKLLDWTLLRIKRCFWILLPISRKMVLNVAKIQISLLIKFLTFQWEIIWMGH